MAAIIGELRTLSAGKNSGLSPHFFVEFLRTRVSESAAAEVQAEIDSILNQAGSKDQTRDSATQAGVGVSTKNDIVLLRAGITFSEGGKSIRIKPSTAEALVARKLHLVTGATMEEDRKQLVDDIAHLEDILASSATEGVEVETILQAALAGHVGEGGEHPKEEKKEEENEEYDGEEEEKLTEYQIRSNVLEGDITLASITDRIAQLRMIFEKSKESNEDDEISAIHYVAAQLQELEVKVESASEHAFSRYDNGDVPVVVNIKDLLVARKRLKEAKAAFDAEALKVSGEGKEGVDKNEFEAAHSKLVQIDGSDEQSLNAFGVLSAVESRIPQISQTLLERNMMKLLKGGGSKAATAALNALSQDIPKICTHLSSFAVSRNGALAIDETILDVQRACVKAGLECVIARVAKSAATKDGEHVPSGINVALGDARSYIKHCESFLLGKISSAGGGSIDDMNNATRWLRERSLLLYLSLFRYDDRSDATVAFSESDSAAIFFSALASVPAKELGITYSNAADWFANNLM